MGKLGIKQVNVERSMNDYTWKVMQSGNPNKAWIVDMQLKKKISALMSVTAARNIATAHNMIVGYLQQARESDNENN